MSPLSRWTDLSGGLNGVVVARVEEVREHPNADRLTLCTVESGPGERVRVVCGAPNVRPGGLYPLAPVGATLPGDRTIERLRIRGETSEGMLCSARELGLGSDQSGLLELPEGCVPGARLVDALGLADWRLDVEVTANRGDLLSHIGNRPRARAPGGHAFAPSSSGPGRAPR